MATDSRGPELLRVCIGLFIVTAITILLRCYVRTRMVKHFGIDDWFMVAAFVCFAIYMTFVLLGVRYGTGQHMWDLTPENATRALKFWWFSSFGYCSTMITSKVSIGCFLLRITNRRIDIWIIYISIGITVVSGVVYFFIVMFQCSPVSLAWDKTQDGSCMDVNVIMTFTWIYSILNIIGDLTFSILPCFLVWNLQMHRRNKIALLPVLTIACVASAAIIIRFAYIHEFSNPDFLYRTIDIAIWSTVEQSLAITAGSLATLTPLFRLIRTQLGLLSSRSKRASRSERPSGHRLPSQDDLETGQSKPSRLSKVLLKPSGSHSLSLSDGSYTMFDYESPEPSTHK